MDRGTFVAFSKWVLFPEREMCFQFPLSSCIEVEFSTSLNALSQDSIAKKLFLQILFLMPQF